MAQISSQFIGPEGGQLRSFRPSGLGIGNDPRFFSDSDLLKEISIAKSIEAQRGLTKSEAEQLSVLLQEQEARQLRRSGVETEELKKGLEGTTVSTTPSGVPVTDIEREERLRTEEQKRAIADIFGKRQEEALQTLGELFGQRGRVTREELASLGILRSPIAATRLFPLEQERARAIADIIRGTAAERSRSELGLESELSERLRRAREFGTEAGFKERELGQRGRISLAELGQRGRQFGQTFGLAREEFEERRRQAAIEDLRKVQELELAEELGKLEAKSKEPGVFEKISGITSGITGLVSGITGLTGAVKKPKKKTEIKETIV